jgi:hypothetical protein
MKFSLIAASALASMASAAQQAFLFNEPNQNAVVPAGTNVTSSWSIISNVGIDVQSFDLALFKDNDFVFNAATGLPAAVSRFVWFAPADLAQGDNYNLRIITHGGNATSIYQSGGFSIAGSSVDTTSNGSLLKPALEIMAGVAMAYFMFQ